MVRDLFLLKNKPQKILRFVATPTVAFKNIVKNEINYKIYLILSISKDVFPPFESIVIPPV